MSEVFYTQKTMGLKLHVYNNVGLTRPLTSFRKLGGGGGALSSIPGPYIRKYELLFIEFMSEFRIGRNWNL